MIGRNGPDSAALLGGQGPQWEFTELARMAVTANNEGQVQMNVLLDWDHPAHPEYWYFRSDHTMPGWNSISDVHHTAAQGLSYPAGQCSQHQLWQVVKDLPSGFTAPPGRWVTCPGNRQLIRISS